MKHYPFLDIIRALAILGVVLVHLPYLGGVSTPHWFEIGKIGIPLFFMLSAYTLCLSQASKTIYSRSDFFQRRFFRIYPLFLLLIGYIFFLDTLDSRLGLAKFDHYPRQAYLSKLTMTYGFFPQFTNNFFLGEWTLSNEAIFYLLFPLLFPRLRDSWKGSLVFSLGAIAIHYAWRYGWGIYKLSFNPLPSYIREYEYYAFPYHLIDFAAGFVLYHVHQFFYDKKVSKIFLFLSGGYTIGTIVYFAWLRQQDIPLNHIRVVITLMVGIFVILQTRDRWDGLGTKILQYIAKVSYSIYLWNLPIMVMIYHYGKDLLARQKILLCFLALFVVTALSFQYEQWGVKRRRRS